VAQKQSRDYLGRRTGRAAHADLSATAPRSLQIRQCLEKMGVKTGDRVALYMPLVPELAIAMLACARIGATHTVIFGGFSADAIRDRVNDGECKLIVTADGGYRRGAEMKLKDG
jgi:acyl-coenzyme A synthetase/AMP-(fatty) acid ligase